MAENTTPPKGSADADVQGLIGEQIVVDTDSTYIYIGTLEKVGRDFLALSHVDVHETSDSKSTKEQYAHEARKLGSRSNRELTYVRMARVLSISRLDDVIQF
jgi:hypothetical protein